MSNIKCPECGSENIGSSCSTVPGEWCFVCEDCDNSFDKDNID